MILINASTTNIVIDKLKLNIQPNEIIEIDDDIVEEYLKEYINKRILVKLKNVRLKVNKINTQKEKDLTQQNINQNKENKQQITNNQDIQRENNNDIIENKTMVEIKESDIQNKPIKNRKFRSENGLKIPDGFIEKMAKIKEEIRNKIHNEIEITTKNEVKELGESESKIYFGRSGIYNCKDVKGGRISNRFPVIIDRSTYIDSDADIVIENRKVLNNNIKVNNTRKKSRKVKCIINGCEKFARKNSKYCNEHYIKVLKGKIYEIKKNNNEKYKKENINKYILELKKIKREIQKDKNNMNLLAKKRILQSYIKKFASEHFHLDCFNIGVIVNNKALVDKNLIIIPNQDNNRFWVGDKKDFNKLLNIYKSKYKD